jgi:hypothetical protein
MEAMMAFKLVNKFLVQVLSAALAGGVNVAIVGKQTVHNASDDL